MISFLWKLFLSIIGITIMDKINDGAGLSEDQKYQELQEYVLKQESSGYEDYQ